MWGIDPPISLIAIPLFLSRSCYNAFSAFHDLETIAIDIAPADEVNLFSIFIQNHRSI